MSNTESHPNRILYLPQRPQNAEDVEETLQTLQTWWQENEADLLKIQTE